MPDTGCVWKSTTGAYRECHLAKAPNSDFCPRHKFEADAAEEIAQMAKDRRAKNTAANKAERERKAAREKEWKQFEVEPSATPTGYEA